MDQPTTRRLQTSMSTANEWLNADLKHALGSRAQTRTKDKLRAVTKAHMDLLEQSPERVRSYINDPMIKYAA